MKKLKEKFGDWEGFKSWFENVYWFHYRWPTLAGVVVIAVALFLVLDSVNKVHYDLSIVVASKDTIADSAFDEINKVVSDAVGDLNGNGKTEIQFVVLSMGDDDIGIANQQRIYLCLSDTQYVIYLLDESNSSLFTAPELEYFDPLSDYEITPDTDNEYRKSLADVPLFKRAGLTGLYLSIMNHSSSSDDEDYADQFQASLKAVDAILSSD